MPMDEDLAERVRDCLAHRDDVTERRMFGGLGFMVRGSMAVAASGQDGLMVRVPREETDAYLDEPGVEVVVMKDRPIKGWVRLASEHLADEAALTRWVDVGVAAAEAAPKG